MQQNIFSLYSSTISYVTTSLKLFPHIFKRKKRTLRSRDVENHNESRWGMCVEQTSFQRCSRPVAAVT
jgi:hypothetical protein